MQRYFSLVAEKVFKKIILYSASHYQQPLAKVPDIFYSSNTSQIYSYFVSMYIQCDKIDNFSMFLYAYFI